MNDITEICKECLKGQENVKKAVLMDNNRVVLHLDEFVVECHCMTFSNFNVHCKYVFEIEMISGSL